MLLKTRICLNTLVKFRSTTPLQSAASVSFKSRDPFGLKNEVDLEQAIQGIYTNPPEQKTVVESVDPNPTTSSIPEKKNPDAAFLESKYGRVSVTRAEKILASNASAEAAYLSHFGQIRFDKDNPVTIHGQFDDSLFNPDAPEEPVSLLQIHKKSQRNINSESTNAVPEGINTFDYGASQANPQNFITPRQNSRGDVGPAVNNAETAAKLNQVSSVEQKQVTEAVKEGPAVQEPDIKIPKTAAEFLRMMRRAEKQAQEAEVEVKVAGKSIKLPKSGLVIEKKEHVPKVYHPIEWSEMTHDDVWAYLRKQICFQNEFLVAINKPFGLPMHSATTECRHTFIDFLEEFAKFCRVKEVFPCHRLDKDTTGVLVVAKNEQAAAAIKSKFANRSISKQYFTIVKNVPAMYEGTIKIPIGEGRIPKSNQFRAVLRPDLDKYNIKTMQKECSPATTWFKVLTSQPFGAFIEVHPETGLTHQIRVHLAHGLGCPILGDHKYSHRDKMAPQRLHTEILDRLKVKQSKVRYLPLHLHCSKLEFTMPDGFMSKNFHGPVFIHAKLPFFFQHTLQALGLKRRR